ncbi:class I SAM-dependent methyltransferase [Candidatus Woesearchaeota archaeon]|nr:class I SAM-dependent methyltransferase [Candidatus Woesearchaeota archaeon]
MNIKTLIKIYRKIAFDQRKEYDKIAFKYMKKCRNILDVGCGIGRFISLSPKRISGIDHSDDSIRICKKKGYNVTKANVKNLPFDSGSFDGVHSSHVIEHLYPEYAYEMLTELVRVLKVGGIMVIRSPMLYEGFFDDFTHVKPYHPKALFHYLITEEKTDQTTKSPINAKFKLLKLKYRRAPLFLGIEDTKLFFLTPIFNLLYGFGISSFKKTGYMLILKKIA